MITTPLVTALESQHSDYTYLAPTWLTIKDIRAGAIAIHKNIRAYLPKRPGEAEDLYALRMAKASWTPILSTAIRELVVKMVAAPLHIEGIEGPFWEAFKDNTDGIGRDETDLLTELFSNILYYGKVFVAVDRAVLSQQPRSLYEQNQTMVLPKVVIYDPLMVLNWGEDWLISREVSQTARPFEKASTNYTWRLWSPETITTYTAKVSIVNGVLNGIYKDSNLIPIGSPDATATLVSDVAHGFRRIPILKLELPSELWTGNNCYAKQLQHFAIESSWTDAGMTAGTIQRVFTPTPPFASNDPSVVYDEPDYSGLKSDNAHVLIGNGFQFVESSGSAIASLTNQLETIESQIRAIVSMTDSNVTKGALQQSGASKVIDREPLEATMKAYGKKVSSFYQDILQLVADAGNQPNQITVNGLDSYSVNTLDDLLAQSLQLTTILKGLPPTALKLWYGKLANVLAGSRSALLDNQIAIEIDGLWSSGIPEGILPVVPDALDKGNKKV